MREGKVERPILDVDYKGMVYDINTYETVCEDMTTLTDEQALNLRRENYEDY